MKRKLLIAGLILGAVAVARGMMISYYGQLVNEPALTYTKSYTLDLNKNGIDYLTAQAVCSTATIPAVTFTDGKPSTGTITVVDPSKLAAAYASNMITVVSTTGLSGAYLTLNGTGLREGNAWTISTATGTAISIAAAINNISLFTTSVSSNVIYTTCTVIGTLGNSYTLTSSTPAALTVSSPTYMGGLDNAWVSLNGIFLTQGTDWTAVATASGTAKAISDAIVSNSTLSSLITSTWTTGGVVYATSTHAGSAYNYGLFTSSAALISLSSSTMLNGTDSDLVLVSSAISKSNKFTVGLPVLFATSAGTAPGQLVTGTTYYAIPASNSRFSLASTSTGAVAGLAVGCTFQTLAGGGSFSVSPLTYSIAASTPTLSWTVSNDGASWVSAGVANSTYTVSTISTTTWDFGFLNYRFLKLNVTGPGAGGVNVVVTGNGKNTSQKPN